MNNLKTNKEIFTDLNNLTIEELKKLFNNELFKLEEEKREQLKELYTYNLNIILKNIIIKNCIPKIEKFNGQNIGEIKEQQIEEILKNEIIEILPILKDFKNVYNLPRFYFSDWRVRGFKKCLTLNFLNLNNVKNFYKDTTFFNVYIENNQLVINENKLINEDLKDCNYINNINEFIPQIEKFKKEAEEIKNEYNKKIKSLKNLKNYNIYNNFFNYDFKELY